MITFYGATAPKWATAALARLHHHTQTHHTRYNSPGRVIGPSQRPLPDNTQHAQETDIDSLGRIQTHNPSKRAAALDSETTGIGV